MYIEHHPADRIAVFLTGNKGPETARDLAPGLRGIYEESGELVGLEIATSLVEVEDLDVVGFPRVMVRPAHGEEG